MGKVNKEYSEEIRRQLQTTSNDPNLTLVLVHQFDFEWDENGKPKIITSKGFDHKTDLPE